MTRTPNPENQVLEPCPLCGSTDLFLRDIAGWELDCRGCELSLVLADDPSREGLIQRWNTRVRAGGEGDAEWRKLVIGKLRELEVKFNWTETGKVLTGVRQFIESHATTPPAATAGEAQLNERCEWNPLLRVASLDPPRDTDCRSETWWSIGHGDRNFHVCDSCARLPEFHLRRKRDPINANPLVSKQATPTPSSPARAAAEELIEHVAHSGVEFDGQKDYIVVQIDRDIWQQIQKLASNDKGGR